MADFYKDSYRQFPVVTSPAAADIQARLTSKDVRYLKNYTIDPAARGAQAIVGTPNNAAGGDFTDIQAALSHVNSLGGGTVLLKSGTYTISSSLTIYSNTSLIGINNTGCIIDFNSTTNNLSADTSAQNILIANLTFKNCWNTTTGTIYFNLVGHSEIKNCQFSANKNGSNNGYDLYFYGCFNVSVRGCNSASSGVFLFADSMASLNEVSGCDLSGNANYVFQGGVTGNGAGQTLYQNNIIVDCVKSVFFGKFNIASIVYNIIDFNSQTLTQPICDFNSSANMRVIGNVFDAESGGHVAIDMNDSPVNEFSSNRITGDEANTPIVALAASSDLNMFNGNIFNSTTSGMDGIKLVDSDANVIIGNAVLISGAGTSYGVNISNAGCVSNVVVGNFLQANTADTQDLGTTSTIASNN